MESKYIKVFRLQTGTTRSSYGVCRALDDYDNHLEHWRGLPTPMEENLSIYSYERCGTTIDNFHTWFPIDVLTKLLKESELYLAVFIVPVEAAKVGKLQVVFNPYEAKLRKVYSLEDAYKKYILKE